MLEPATFSAIAASCAAIAAAINAYVGYQNRSDALDKQIIDSLTKKVDECNEIVVRHNYKVPSKEENIGETLRIISLLYLSIADIKRIDKRYKHLLKYDFFVNINNVKKINFKEYFVCSLHPSIFEDLKIDGKNKEFSNVVPLEKMLSISEFYKKQLR